MKILLFGKNGQVGWELNRSLLPLGELIALERKDADFSDPESLRIIVQQIKPDIIVNAVAYTAVDKAEDEEKLALLINGESPRVLAQEALKLNALLVHYSTDYVFDGCKKGPYIESDITEPVNAYGRTKLAGEKFIMSSGCGYLIFRTSWVYSVRSQNFLLTILRLAQEREELSVISDQVGSPTSARLIAETTLICLRHASNERYLGEFKSGLYHLTASGYTSWYGFAEIILKIAESISSVKLKTKDVLAISSDEYRTSARRPMNSRLANVKLQSEFGVIMPDWDRALSLCLEELIEKY
ncbi:MAG: dTDP-4-dehydrorhamnose reductase [Gammaproteobacteria bacterium]|nr:dTDP-4-dehydrorhamnose reductase [Gammaproteobacteria bacterium]MBT8348464.1 dTDP-4-dehydrorhamnose reductase [Sulfurovum sp.]NNJ45028.1 dTDP-4-dehydrorhamnose reductase [Sulfurovum sp.]